MIIIIQSAVASRGNNRRLAFSLKERYLPDNRRASWWTMRTWYVTFEVHRSGMLSSRRRGPRETMTFDTEAEAKNFARTKFHDGLIVYAGTINPFSPKQVISSKEMPHWLDETPEQSPANRHDGADDGE
jgi:hypothetical protein